MARIRSIKPEFFTSLTVAGLSPHARLTFIGLWTQCDDEGRCIADPRLVRAALWPLDDRSIADVEGDLRELTESSLIRHYEVGGKRYFAIRSWSEHQKINRPTPSRFPSPDDGVDVPVSGPRKPVTSSDEGSPSGQASLIDDSLSAHGGLTPERKGKEGKGKDSATRGAAAPAPPTDPAPDNAQALIAEWVDACNGNRPPGRVIGHVAKELAAMLTEGIPYADVRAGLIAWHHKGLHPAALASVVHETRTAAHRRPKSTTDDRVRMGLELAAKYDAEDGVTTRLPLEGTPA